MKKFLYILIALFFLISCSQADDEDGFQLNTFFPVEKSKTPSVLAVESSKEESAQQEAAQNSSKKKKKDKNKKFNYQTNSDEEIQRGYYGVLPDIEAAFKYMQQQTKTSTNMDMKVISDDEIDEANLKEAPYDDTLFLDKIVKKEASSLYVNDLVKIKFFLENLRKCLEENGDIQRFNANVNMIDLQCQNFKEKYENTSNSLKESYNDILALNYQAKILGNLKYNANYYARYVPTNQGQYSKENIKNEEQKLLAKVNKTIYSLLKEMDKGNPF